MCRYVCVVTQSEIVASVQSVYTKWIGSPDAKKLAALEEILYGKDPSSDEADDGVEPRLPIPDEVIKIMTAEG